MEGGTFPFPLSQVALTALHKHAWIPMTTLPAGEEEWLGQMLQSALTRYLPASQGLRAMRGAPTKFSDALNPFCSSCTLTFSKVSAARMSWALTSSPSGTLTEKNTSQPWASRPGGEHGEPKR